MPDTSTEVVIASQTLGSAAATIDFTSIPATYTDLRVVINCQNTVGQAYLKMQLNGDTASNYSYTELYGTGASAASTRSTSNTSIFYRLMDAAPYWDLATIDIFSYAGSTFKTSLGTMSADANGSGFVDRNVGLWRSTSAITSINLFPGTDNFSTGTVATLYGIL